jgi:hypothetical protein
VTLPVRLIPILFKDLQRIDGVNVGLLNDYRAKPDFTHVPVAVRTLSQLGALHDTERSPRRPA